MITRPLDLASKLRPPPRNFDVIFLVNGGLIALFFVVFGSRFVLSPGMRVNGEDLRVIETTGPIDYTATSASVTVNASQQIFIERGLVELPRLQEWLVEEAKKSPRTTLLLIVDARVPMEMTSTISGAAKAAGFAAVQVMVQPARMPGPLSLSP